MKLPYSIAVLWAALYSFFPSRSQAQSDRDTSFSNLINCIASCSMYTMEEYDSLYQLKIVDSLYGSEKVYTGWIKREDANGQIEFWTNNHQVHRFSKSFIAERKAIRQDARSMKALFAVEEKPGRLLELRFGHNYLLALWLYKKGYPKYAARLLRTEELRSISDNFGTIYYDSMLQAFRNRNYPEAIRYGEHLLKPVFNEYKYHNEIAGLTRQLSRRTEDFKTLCLPVPAVWDSLKATLSRTQQIKYLGERLKLINCVQQGQPADIGYSMFQYSVPYSESAALGLNYWEPSARYAVVNPYSELLAMNLRPAELEYLLPYLSDCSYIPAYSYFRDFFSERMLHKLSWVVLDLFAATTDMHFCNELEMDTMAAVRKQELVAGIRKWCRDNERFSEEERTERLMSTTDKWAEFGRAMYRAQEKKYRFLLPMLAKRFDDFHMAMPRFLEQPQYYMAQVMYEAGDATYASHVLQWSRSTKEDGVQLWAALFLLKHDKQQYDYAMGKLEKLLAENRTQYYSYAIEPLLSLKTDRARKLAEGILDDDYFQMSISWDYELNIVKMLLLAKSTYTHDLLLRHLNEDHYVEAVDKLRGIKGGYDASWDKKKKMAYVRELASWFRENYRLYAAGKPHGLNLVLAEADAPVHFLDSQ